MTRTLTGWHVLAMFVLGFGTIVAVNVTLAVNAVRTFPGLEVANSYVASQSFDDEREAQGALGWEIGARLEDGLLHLTITDAEGPVEAGSLTLRLGHPTTLEGEQLLEPVWTGAGYQAAYLPGGGRWRLDIEAVAADGTPFRQRRIVE